MQSPTLPFLALSLLAATIPAGEGGATWTVPLEPEEPGGYAANPATLKTPLRQDLTSVKLERLENGRHALTLQGGPAPLALADVDLGLLLPRVPAYVRGNEDLLRYALIQREFNRNEVKFGAVGDVADFKIANNCLRTNLWEIMLDQKVENGNAMVFHGWFEFPRDEHARLFEAANGKTFAECERLIAQYPIIDGMAAPLDALRKVVSERKVAVQNLATEAPIRFGEQRRKAKLVLTPDIQTYADFASPAKQPIRTASFSEPGYYDPARPVEFDLAWLAKPTQAVVREVRVGEQRATEVELAFAGGRRIVVGDRDLGALPERTAAPDNDKDTLRLTFGIGTPDIYASLAERSAEAAADRPNWLFLLGPDGKHVDNHQAGVDRVFCWAEQGGKLHVYLVGYERIAVVAHMVVPVAAE
jgi:hypothetical protein